jgi:hypothetical protein
MDVYRVTLTISGEARLRTAPHLAKLPKSLTRQNSAVSRHPLHVAGFAKAVILPHKVSVMNRLLYRLTYINVANLRRKPASKTETG